MDYGSVFSFSSLSSNCWPSFTTPQFPQSDNAPGDQASQGLSTTEWELMFYLFAPYPVLFDYNYIQLAFHILYPLGRMKVHWLFFQPQTSLASARFLDFVFTLFPSLLYEVLGRRIFLQFIAPWDETMISIPCIHHFKLAEVGGKNPHGLLSNSVWEFEKWKQ